MVRNHTVLAWSPLGGGRLGDGQGEVAKLLEAKAAESGVSAAVAAYAWLMAHPRA